MRRSALRASRAVALAAALCAASAGSGSALADPGDRQAAALFREGAGSFRRRDYRAAATAFEAADRASPHGATLYNAGLSWEAAGERPRAADAYALALTRGGLEGAELGSAQARLAVLEHALGRIDVQAPAGAQIAVEHLRGASAPVRVHVAAGTHEVQIVFSDGRALTRGVEVTAGVVASIVVESPPVAQAALPLEASSAAASARPARRTVGWLGLGTAVALSGVALGAGSAALGARDAFVASGDTDRSAHDRAASLRTWTNVAWAAAGVTGLGGAVLVLSAPSGRPAVASLRFDLRGLAVGGWF